MCVLHNKLCNTVSLSLQAYISIKVGYIFCIKVITTLFLFIKIMLCMLHNKFLFSVIHQI